MIEPMRRQRRPTMTDRMVAALPKQRKRYVTPDPEQRGLFVRVMPKGANVYAAVARNSFGKQVWATLGSADVLPIEQARARAREAIRRIRDGLPAFKPPPVKPDSFADVTETWLRRHVAKNGLRTRAEIERVLAKNILPHWANLALVDIKRSTVAALLDHIEDNHGPGAADHALVIVRSIASWYAKRHDDYTTPFVRGMRRTDPKLRTRDRILDDDELRRVWHAAEGAGTFGALVRALLLTAQRRGAVVNMKWEDLDGNVWRIPDEERAKGTGGTLVLPEPTMKVIHTLPRHASNPYVFAAARGAGSLNGFSKAKKVFDRRCGVSNWTLHDLRRTSRSLLARAGVPPHVAERTLGHAIAGVAGVYDRHGLHRRESRRAGPAGGADRRDRQAQPRREGGAVAPAAIVTRRERARRAAIVRAAEELWESSRRTDFKSVLFGLEALRPALPKWLYAALYQLVCAKLPEATVHEQRYWAVVEARGEGRTWDQSYERASERLRGRSARGTANAMRQSYIRVARERRRQQ